MTIRYLIEPVRLHYDGRDADAHRMDAQLLGQSLSGVARLYNSVGHFHFHGELKRSNHSDVRIQVGPPEPGSIFYLIYMVLVHGSMPLYPELLFEMGELAIPAFIKAIISKRTGQNDNLEKALDVIDRQNERYHELVRVSQDNDMRTRESLIGVIGNLTSQNRSSLRDMAAPVGKTVNEIVQIPARDGNILIDQATAESLRSPEKVTVGEIQKFHGIITALDTISGSFKLEEAGTRREYKGNITDPLISTPQNIYSHALDTKEPIEVIAKPTFREDGEVHKLFVSDAKRA